MHNVAFNIMGSTKGAPTFGVGKRPPGAALACQLEAPLRKDYEFSKPLVLGILPRPAQAE